MTLETIAGMMARAISRTADAAKASAPTVALVLYAVQNTKGDAIDALERLYLQTFKAAPSTKRKAVQSHFTRLRGLMAALVDYQDHPEMVATIEAELAMVDFSEDEVTKAEGAKRYPKAPTLTKAADSIRRDEAKKVKGKFKHEHANFVREDAQGTWKICEKTGEWDFMDTTGEALKVLDHEITKHAEIRASLEAYRTKIVNDAIGAPTEFEIKGDENAAPSFSVKALN